MDKKNINNKYVAVDDFNAILKQRMAGPLNGACERLGDKLISMKSSNRRILGALFVCGDMTIKELSLVATVSFANISKNIDELIAEGYVTRHEDPNNRKYIIISMTDKARALNNAYEILVGELNDCYFKEFLTRKEIDSFHYYLSQLISIIEKLDPSYMERFNSMEDVERELERQRNKNTGYVE